MVRPIPKLYEATESFSQIELPSMCFTGLTPTVLISLILLLFPSFSLSFHFTLPLLPYFTHPLQLPYFLHRLPLDSSKLYVCVLTLVAPSTCK